MLLLLAVNVFCQVMWGHTNASRTSGGRFRGSVPLNELRSVHQEPFFSTEYLFRTVEACFYTECFRRCVAYTRSPYLAPNAYSVHQESLSGTEYNARK